MKALDPESAALAIEVARALAARGQRAWLVGGMVRDLALDRPAKDVDLATAATPLEVEEAFEHTLAVGKAFGTIVVLVNGGRRNASTGSPGRNEEGSAPRGEVQVTTFRAESDYADGRRPNEVRYGASLEEDARRRDFTCNAMYLDPLSDELMDPMDGLADLRAGRLVCVGDPMQRFSEDGLRLIRLARFSAALGLAVQPHTLKAARASGDRLQGVSPERRLEELERIAQGPAPAEALSILHEIGLLARVLPGASDHADWEPGQDEIDSVRRLGPAPGLRSLLGVLLGSLAEESPSRARDLLMSLRPSRRLLQGTLDLWELQRRLARLLERPEPPRRSEWVELVQHEAWPGVLEVWAARDCAGAAAPESAARIGRLRDLETQRGTSDLAPAPWIGSEDLRALGVPNGPRWGTLLRDAQRAQIDGRFTTRDQALDWLKTQLRS